MVQTSWLDEPRIPRALAVGVSSNHIKQQLNSIYEDALKYIKSKTNYEIDIPSSCPYSLEQILDKDWFRAL